MNIFAFFPVNAFPRLTWVVTLSLRKVRRPKRAMQGVYRT